MSRKLICDFCSTEFPDYNANVDASKTLNWVEHLDKVNDVCAECAMMVVHNLVERGGLSVETIRDFHRGDFTRKVAFVNPPKAAPTPPVDPDLLKPEEPARGPRRDPHPDEEDLDFDLDNFHLEPPGDPTSFDPPTVFHLAMHGAGLNPEHELLFQTLDEAKDYAVKNAQLFPEAAYFLSCPDGTDLVGTPDPPASYNQNDTVTSIHWKVKSQPKKP